MLKRKSQAFRIICFLLAFLLIQTSLEQVQAQPTPFLPSPNYIDLSIPYSFPVLRGMRVYPDKPFDFDFVVDSGDQPTLGQKETALLVKYFLTFLTIPEEDLWVNLSPYESRRIIPDDMALTNAGNTLLEQDKLLKQLSSSLTYPETSLGKKFWDKVYKIAYEKYGTTDLPINTYNKVWIVPDKAIIYDMGDSAMVGDTHLKVMMEEDYLALKKNQRQATASHSIASEITKEIILPELEKEVNTGKNFAPVRQIFYSLVLADWFKRAIRRNILSVVFINKRKTSGIDSVNRDATEKIYKQYLRIFKKGAYNYIREDVDPNTNQVVPRKYFSGGCNFGDSAMWAYTVQVPDRAVLGRLLKGYIGSNFAEVAVKLDAIGGDLGSLGHFPQVRVSSSLVKSLAFAVGLAAAGSLAPAIRSDSAQITFKKIIATGALIAAGYGGLQFYHPEQSPPAATKISEPAKPVDEPIPAPALVPAAPALARVFKSAALPNPEITPPQAATPVQTTVLQPVAQQIPQPEPALQPPPIPAQEPPPAVVPPSLPTADIKQAEAVQNLDANEGQKQVVDRLVGLQKSATSALAEGYKEHGNPDSPGDGNEYFLKASKLAEEYLKLFNLYDEKPGNFFRGSPKALDKSLKEVLNVQRQVNKLTSHAFSASETDTIRSKFDQGTPEKKVKIVFALGKEILYLEGYARQAPSLEPGGSVNGDWQGVQNLTVLFSDLDGQLGPLADSKLEKKLNKLAANVTKAGRAAQLALLPAASGHFQSRPDKIIRKFQDDYNKANSFDKKAKVLISLGREYWYERGYAMQPPSSEPGGSSRGDWEFVNALSGEYSRMMADFQALDPVLSEKRQNEIDKLNGKTPSAPIARPLRSPAAPVRSFTPPPATPINTTTPLLEPPPDIPTPEMPAPFSAEAGQINIPPPPTVHAPKTKVEEILIGSVSETIEPDTLTEELRPKIKGLVTEQNTAKRDYDKNEQEALIVNNDLEEEFFGLTDKITIAKKDLSDLKDFTGATQTVIQKAEGELAGLQKQLDAVDAKREMGRVKVPYKSHVDEFYFVGDKDNPPYYDPADGKPLVSVTDRERLSFVLNPQNKLVEGFNDIKLTLIQNEVPMTVSVSQDNWALTPFDAGHYHLKVTVAPPAGIDLEKPVLAKADFYAPVTSEPGLNSVSGFPITTWVKEYTVKPATAKISGPIQIEKNKSGNDYTLGDRVKKNEIGARIDVSPIQRQLSKDDDQLKNIQFQVSQATAMVDGRKVVNMDRFELQRLRFQEAEITRNKEKLEKQIALQNVTFPEDGIIVKIAQKNLGGSVNEGNEVFGVRTNFVYLGDIINTNPVAQQHIYTIPVPAGLLKNKTEGSPVVVKNGPVYLPATIVGFNHHLTSAKENMAGQVGLRIKVEDRFQTLQLETPVTVILPTDEEDKRLRALLYFRKSDNAMSSSGAPPPPDWLQDQAMLTNDSRRDFLTGLGRAFVWGVVARAVEAPLVAQVSQAPRVYFPPGESSLNFTQTAQLVLGNSLLTAQEASDYLQKQLAEKLPGAKKFDLIASAYLDGNNHLSYVGGLRGALNNISGGLLQGNALTGLSPTEIGLNVLLEATGRIVDHFSHIIDKKRALAKDVTMTAYYVYQGARYQQLYNAQVRLIDIGAVQQKIARLNELISYLEGQRETFNKGEEAGFITTSEKSVFEATLSHYRMQREKLTGDLQKWSDEFYPLLHNLNGQPRTEFHRLVSADLPWAGNFPTVAEIEDQEAHMFERLTSDNSPAPRMQEALSARKVMEKTMVLQRQKMLPTVNFEGIFTPPAPNGGVKNSIFEQAQGGGAVWRASEMAPGANPSLEVVIPIFNKQLSTLTQILAEEQQKTESRIAQTRVQLTTELGKAADIMRSSINNIREAEINYGSVLNEWKNRAGQPERYAPHQLVSQRAAIDESLMDIDAAKVEYFKAEAVLRQMQLLGQGESLVKDHAMIIKGKSRREFLGDVREGLKWAILTGVAGDQLGAQQQAQAPAEAGLGDQIALSQGVLPGSQADLLIVKGLMGDPGKNIRRPAVRRFLESDQNAPGFMEVLEDEILTSGYQDVVQPLLRYMVALPDPDLRFFVRIINRAAAENKTVKFAQAIQAFRDVLVNNPKVFEPLTEENSQTHPGSSIYSLSPDDAKNIFLTFLVTEPGSITSILWLKSDYWNTQDFAKMFNELIAYANGLPEKRQRDKDRIHRLAALDKDGHPAGLLYDWILRKEALDNIPDVFTLGTLNNNAFGYLEDAYTIVTVTRLVDQTRRVLNSPQWRDMKKYIKPELYEKAKNAVDGLISQNPAQPNESGFPLSKDLSDLQVPQGIFLSYFRDLTPGENGEQAEYVEKSQPAELVRMLQYGIALPGKALSRLMANFQGRLLLLDLYLETPDTETGLLGTIENLGWQNYVYIDAQALDIPVTAFKDIQTAGNPITAYKDAQILGNPVTIRIFREGLAKMYGRLKDHPLKKLTKGEPVKQEDLLNVTLGLNSSLVLHSPQDFIDPRGDVLRIAQIKRMALEWAVDVVKQSRKNSIVWWVGLPVNNAQEEDLLSRITLKLNQEHDPTQVEAYFNGSIAKNLNPNNRGIFGDIATYKSKFEERIANKDQTFPHSEPVVLKYFISVVAGFLGTGMFFVWKKVHYRKKGPKDNPNSVQADAQRSTDVAPRVYEHGVLVSGGSKGNNGKKEPTKNRAMISNEADIHTLVQVPINKWKELDDRLSNKNRLEPQDLQVMDEILSHSSEAFSLMQYIPYLMWVHKDTEHYDYLNEVYRKNYEQVQAEAFFTLKTLENLLQNGNVSFSYVKGLLSAKGLDVDEFLNKGYFTIEENRLILDEEKISKNLNTERPEFAEALKVIGELSQKPPLPRLSQRYQLFIYREGMRENRDNAVKFLRVLKRRAFIDNTNSYKFSDDQWGKELFYYPTRVLLGIQKLWKDSESALPGETHSLLIGLEKSMGGSYNNINETVEDSRARLKEVTEKGYIFNETENLDELNASKFRSFLGRVLTTAAIILLSVPALFLFLGPSIPAIIGLGLAIFSASVGFGNYWARHIELLQMKNIKDMEWSGEQQDQRLDVLIDPQGEFRPMTGNLTWEQRSYVLAELESIEQAEIEFKFPTIPVVVFVAEDEADRPVLKEIMDNHIRGEDIGRNIPVEYLDASKGSGEATVKALDIIEQKYGGGLVILHDKDPLHKKFRVKWAVRNGIRGGGNGVIIIADEFPYLGSMHRIKDARVSSISPRVSFEDARTVGWLHVDFHRDGNTLVKKIKEKPDLKKLREEEEKFKDHADHTVEHFTNEGYDMDHPTRRQVTSVSPIDIFNEEAVKVFNEVRKDPVYYERVRPELMKISLSDMKALLTRVTKAYPDQTYLEREIDIWAEKRAWWPDMRRDGIVDHDAVKKAWIRLGNLMAKKAVNLDLKDPDDVSPINKAEMPEVKANPFMHAYVPSFQTDVWALNGKRNRLVAMASDSDLKKRIVDLASGRGPKGRVVAMADGSAKGRVLPINLRLRNQNGSDNAVIASPAKLPGGIDLDFQPQFIEQFSRAGSAPVPPAGIANMPDGFKGFNFNIVRFTPQLTVNGAFQRMFNSN